jgi:hypothetical protein
MEILMTKVNVNSNGVCTISARYKGYDYPRTGKYYLSKKKPLTKKQIEKVIEGILKDEIGETNPNYVGYRIWHYLKMKGLCS